MIKRLAILFTSFMPGLAMADDAVIDFAGLALDFVVQPAVAQQVPEPSMLPLLAAGGAVAIAVKYIRRKK